MDVPSGMPAGLLLNDTLPKPRFIYQYHQTRGGSQCYWSLTLPQAGLISLNPS
jgi:hypothetical protein